MINDVLGQIANRQNQVEAAIFWQIGKPPPASGGNLEGNQNG